MIRLNFPLQWLKNPSRTELQRYWRETHGAIVASVGAAVRDVEMIKGSFREDPA